jgi:hypothetical protein
MRRPEVDEEGHMRRWIGALAVAAVFVSSAGAASADAATYVGRVQDSDAYIAVLKDGRKIGGYLCDNGNVSRWIQYSWLRDGRAPLRVGTTGERLGSVRIAGRRATGTVEIGGRKHRFRARRTRERDAGLHFAVGKQTSRLLVAGWVLLPDGTQRGAVSRVNMETLRPLDPIRAPTLDPDASNVEIGGDSDLPPADTEPTELVVINIIAILIGLLLPAVQ